MKDMVSQKRVSSSGHMLLVGPTRRGPTDLNGWVLRSQRLSEPEQDQFTSLSGVKRK